MAAVATINYRIALSSNWNGMILKWYDHIRVSEQASQPIPKYLRTSNCFNQRQKLFIVTKLILSTQTLLISCMAQQIKTSKQQWKKRYHHPMLFDFSSNIYWSIFCSLIKCARGVARAHTCECECACVLFVCLFEPLQFRNMRFV